MTSREFCYWLQGMFELNGATELDARQTKMIKNHLDMVFIHEIDPSYPEGKKLQNAHDNMEKFPNLAKLPSMDPPVMRC